MIIQNYDNKTKPNNKQIGNKIGKKKTQQYKTKDKRKPNEDKKGFYVVQHDQLSR